MKKIMSTKILKKAFSATLALSIALGSALIAMPALKANAANVINAADATEAKSAPKVVQTQGVDMALGLGGLRDPVKNTNSLGDSYIPSDYIYLGDNNRGAMLWRVLSSTTDNLGNSGAAFVMSEYLEVASLAGKNYDEAYLSYFTDEEKAILVPYGGEDSESASAFGKSWTTAVPSGLLFAPSVSDVSNYIANYSGSPSLRAYTDASRATAGSWWLRSEDDVGFGFVSAAGAVDSETNLDQVTNFNRLAANLDLSDVVFSTRVDGGWRLALLDKDYDVPVHKYDFAAWITKIDGNDVTISYVNAKPKDVSDDIRELISAIITDATGNVKHYAQLGEVDYTEKKEWYAYYDKDDDGTLELLSPAALYPFHGSVHLDISGDVFDYAAGDKIYVFWEKAYSSRDIDANPNLAYQTTTTSKLVEMCWHEADPEKPATCTRFDTCKKCETQFGGFNFVDIDAHVDDEGNSTIVWEQHLGQYRGEDGFFRDAYIHLGHCTLCNHYLPMDKEGYVSGARPCYCESAENIDCTHGAICDACGNYFVDPMMHSYNINGICNRYTHFQEPNFNKEGDYYEIKTVGNLIWYAQYINSLESYADVRDAKLLNDIDFAVLQNYDAENLKNFNWTPIGVGEGYFSAVFDGNGFEIRNLRCVSDQYDALGFIGQAKKSNYGYPEVRNLGLVDCYFENTNGNQVANAALVAYSSYDLTVENCYVKNTTVKGNNIVGGLIGYTNDGGHVMRCYAVDLTLLENGETVKGWIIREGSGNPAYCFAYGENAGLLDKDGLGLHQGTFIQHGYNCYFLNENGKMDQDNMRKTEEQFTSGLVAYYLGDGFGQTIGTHDYPVLGGDTVYRIEVCGGEGYDRYTYSNEDTLSHIWNGEYVCGEAKTCSVCGETFGDVLEHEFTDINENDSFIWIDNGSYSACSVQTYCRHCGEANPELLSATVNMNFNGGVRADYVATIHIDGVKYSSDVVRIPIITIEQATGIYPSSQIFTGQDYYAYDLVTNTKMQSGEYEAYFLLDGEMVGEYARDAGVYDLYIVGRGRYEYQEFTYKDFFTIEKVEVEVTVTVKDKIVDGTKDFEFELTFSNGVDYSYIMGIYANQYELPSSEVGEYEITGIEIYFYYYYDENSITITYNDTAIARILPRNYVEIINESYKLDYKYGETVPAPKASDFKVDEGSELTFAWFKDGTLLDGVPQSTGEYVLRVSASATDEYIASSVEYTVTVQPKLLEIVIDPYGKCETEIEDLGYDWDDDGKNEERVWYLVEMGETVPIYVTGLPGVDEPVSIDDERFKSTGFYLYWSIYEGESGVSYDEGEDYAKIFPDVPYLGGYRMHAYPHSGNNFGVSSDIGFTENYVIEFNIKVKSPESEIKPVEKVVEYSGTEQKISAVVTLPRWDVQINDYDGYYGYPDIRYYVSVGTSTDFENDRLYWKYIEVDFDYKGSPSAELTFDGSGVWYVYSDAKYTIYTDRDPIEDSEELFLVKITVTVTDADGARVDQIKEAGIYNVTIKTEPCDVNGAVTGEAKEHAATYRVKNATREIYMLVKETEINLDGALPKYDAKDVVFLTGYTLAPGHRIVDLTYNIQLGGYVGAMNMGIITVKDWVIVDENGIDISDEYVIYSQMYEWSRKYKEVYGEEYDNAKNHTVVHAYSNACDATCNIDDCTKTREVEPHRGGNATCSAMAICEVCGNEYGGYDYTEHSETKTVYVRNTDDFRYHDLVYACCGTVISTEEHTVTKSATCTTLAECEKCGIVEGSYDAENHSSEEMYYGINPHDASKHDYMHKCCDAVESSGAHTGGVATCTDLAVCEICKLGYGKLDADNHSSDAFICTVIETSLTRHDVSHACCGAYVGTEAHFGGEATCSDKAVCEGCGAEYGDLAPSNHASDAYTYSPATIGNKHYIFRECCGESVGEEEHSGGEATCRGKAQCQHCGAEYGEIDPSNHAPEEYIYRVSESDRTKHVKIAPCCNVTVAVEDHSGGTATCKDKAKCEYCGEAYGELAAHSSSDPCSGECDTCGAQMLPGHTDADGDEICDLCNERIRGSASDSGEESDTDSEESSSSESNPEESSGSESESTENDSDQSESESAETDVESEKGGEGKTEPKKDGCGSSIGAGAVVVMLSVAISGCVAYKKRKENE